MNIEYTNKNTELSKERENDFIVTSSSSWKSDEETASLPPTELCTSSMADCTENPAMQPTQNEVIGSQFLNEISSSEENSTSLASNLITIPGLQVVDSIIESQKSNEQNYMTSLSNNNSDISTNISYGLQMGMATTPMVVLLNNDKGKMEAGFLLQSPSVMTADSCYLYNRINGIYALAQANLVAQTQQDIAKQLTSITEQNDPHTALKSPAEKSVKEKQDTKTFSCEVENCNKSFTSELQLKNHMEYHASRDKELVCNHEGCGRKFFWPAHLKYHKLTHENERNYQCNVQGCGKKFFTAQRLVVHSLTHSGERPFTCEECNKGFTTAGNLKNHIRTHTGERPYTCTVEKCDKKFAEFSSLRKHLLTHTGEKPFKCEECGKSFTQSGSRQMHMKKHAAQHSGNAKKGEKANTKKNKNRSVVVVHNREEEILHYQDLQVVFSQGVSDQVITVTTQTPSTNEGQLHVSNEMLLSEDVQTSSILHGGAEIIQGNSNTNVVVLSQPEIMVPMSTAFQHGETSGGEEVIYGNDYINTGIHQEEITHIAREQQQQLIHENQTLHEPNKEQSQNISENQNLCTNDKHLNIDPIMESDDEQR